MLREPLKGAPALDLLYPVIQSETALIHQVCQVGPALYDTILETAPIKSSETLADESGHQHTHKKHPRKTMPVVMLSVIHGYI